MEAFYTYTVKTKCLYKNSLYRDGVKVRFPGDPLAVPRHFVCDNAEVEAVRQRARAGALTVEDKKFLGIEAPEPEEGSGVTVVEGASVRGPGRRGRR